MIAYGVAGMPYYDADGIVLYQGDVLDTLAQMADNSVDCVMTSPPYWALRVYSGEGGRIWGVDVDHAHEWQAQPITGEGYTGTARWQHSENGRGEGQPDEKRLREAVSRSTRPEAWSTDLGSQHYCLCGAWRGAYGLEPTHTMYVEHSIIILREIRRVLKPTGVCFWNIGDSYAAGGNGTRDPEKWPKQSRNNNGDRMIHGKKYSGLKPKDMCLIPQRVAIAAQDDGWWVRCDIVWSKPNPMPESITDRPTKAHEYVWMFSKSARYYWDAEAVREPLAASSVQRMAQPNFDNQKGGAKDYANGTNGNRSARQSLVNLKKRTDKQRGHSRKHEGFNDRWDAMPREEQMANGANCRSVWSIATQPSPLPHFASFPEELASRCIRAGCPPDGVVLDPFAGTATTLKVARALGRKAIGIELSRDYCELARKRLDYGIKGVMAIAAGQGEML